MQEEPQPVEVPVEALAPEVLTALLEEFVTRDGTDYGDQERTLEEKVARLREALTRGEARIVYEALSERVNIVVPEPEPA